MILFKYIYRNIYLFCVYSSGKHAVLQHSALHNEATKMTSWKTHTQKQNTQGTAGQLYTWRCSHVHSRESWAVLAKGRGIPLPMCIYIIISTQDFRFVYLIVRPYQSRTLTTEIHMESTETYMHKSRKLSRPKIRKALWRTSTEQNLSKCCKFNLTPNHILFPSLDYQTTPSNRTWFKVFISGFADRDSAWFANKAKLPRSEPIGIWHVNLNKRQQYINDRQELLDVFVLTAMLLSFSYFNVGQTDPCGFYRHKCCF